MSRFFHSGTSTPSSESDEEAERSESEPDEAAEVLSQDDTLSMQSTAGQNVIDRPSTNWSNSHRDFLLHALLEERCMNEVLSTYTNIGSNRRPSRDSPEIQAEAHARYQRLCTQLASYNLISTGLEDERHTITRQRYRDGLDMIIQQQSATTSAPSLRRLLTDPDMDVSPRQEFEDAKFSAPRVAGSAHRPALPYPLRKLIPDANHDERDSAMHLLPANGNNFGPRYLFPARGLHENRYHRDFEELNTLGRGGYGVVYHVRHRLDNQTYAVKKVPLSRARLRSIQRRGQPEMEEVLRELRTLACLDHPNIVRYFGGWIDWVDSTSPLALDQSRTDSRVFSNGAEDAVGGAEEFTFNSAHRVATESSTEEMAVVFEHSDVVSPPTAIESLPKNTLSDNISGSQLRRVGTRSTMVTDGDNTIESVGREIDPSVSMQSMASSVHFTEPTLAIHMQMSLHPMTLADFISPANPRSGSSTAPTLSHCYHLGPSISILLSILDGLEYLHDQGIVHRDVKPANIFLGPHSNPRKTRGSVDLMLCNDCRAQSTATPIRLEVRIGDFGLVSVADPESHETPDSHVVGTEMYRPPSTHGRSPSLDIYALGIVAFELLWKFETRMERLHTIQQLKQGGFPDGFSDQLGREEALAVKDAVQAMLSQQGNGLSIQKIKQSFAAMRLAS